LAVSGAVAWLPLPANVPLQLPEAVHEVALVDDHVSIEVLPLATATGLAISETVGSGRMLTVAVAGELLPPGPLQINEYEVFVMSTPVLTLPPLANAPLQPPEAAQDVASVELQVSVDAAPLAIAGGFAVNVAVGTGAGVTVIVTELGPLLPPGPVQVREKRVSAVSAPVLWLPAVGNMPLQPPEPLQEVALAELQVRVDSAPLLMVVGDALSDAVGTALEGDEFPPPQATNKIAVPIGKSAASRRI
jgi:hypothetical protein